VKAAERVERDQKVLRLWIAGGSYPRIAQAVGLSARQVERIVKATLAAGAARRALLSEEALAVHQERHERLFEAHWIPALNGDHRSAELCRRLLDQNAKLHGLYGEGGGAAGSALPAPTAPLTSGDGADSPRESEEPADELAKLRARRDTAG
jgi:Homeodomain-like domain-containing protein